MISYASLICDSFSVLFALVDQVFSRRALCLGLSNVFPGGSDGKVFAYHAGDPGSIPGLGKFPGEGNGNPLQYSCLENLMDREACSPQVCKESDMMERLHFHFHLRTPPS